MRPTVSLVCIIVALVLAIVATVGHALGLVAQNQLLVWEWAGIFFIAGHLPL